MSIHYSQCWEDPAIVMEALDVNPEDDVVSIASGGDNSFALLLNRPKSLTMVDKNEAQIFLVELKIRAIHKLDYDDFVGFLGATPCQRRVQLYSYLRGSLGQTTRAYWDRHVEDIRQGIIHCGTFERYLSIFRRMVLPLIHTKREVRELLGVSSLEAQRVMYEETWNNLRWQGLFRIFFGKFLLGHLGRGPSCFKHVTLDGVGAELLRRVRRGMTEIPLSGNFFIEYILTGKYRDLDTAHPYLREADFQFLKDHVGNIRLRCQSLEDYLRGLPSGTVSKFNLSDIFEYMSEGAFEIALREIQRVSRNRSRLAYWTLFVPRIPSPALSDDTDLFRLSSEKLKAADRTFFYGDFSLWNIAREQRKDVCT